MKLNEKVHSSKTQALRKENLRNAVKTVTFDYPDGGNHCSYCCNSSQRHQPRNENNEAGKRRSRHISSSEIFSKLDDKIFKTSSKLILNLTQANTVSSDKS